MPELPDVRNMLEMAERAAGDGDFSSAEKLLKDVARIQETELGPLHPDLASTMNNLAIVAERTGQLGDAETCYRRAAVIAAESLPADHPMVAESRQNLEGFCREHGVPIIAAAIDEPSMPALGSGAVAAEGTAPPAPERATAADTRPEVVPPSAVGPASPPSTSTDSTPRPAAPGSASWPLSYVAVGAIVLLAGAILITRPWSSPEKPVAAPSTPTPEPVAPPVAAPAPIEPAQPPKAAADPSAARSSRPPRSQGAVTLATAELCQTFSTAGDRWRCDPPGESVARGRLVLYTRVKSSRDTVVVHRWYRGSTLRQAVKLTVRANASDGYRTYSRQNLDDSGNWRVEVANADGAVLHEQRFTVR